MLTMFVRAFVLYVLVILLMRLMGKRQIGQLQPFELVFSVIVADLAASPMSDVGIPLLYGVMPIAALMLCYALFSLVTLRASGRGSCSPASPRCWCSRASSTRTRCAARA